MRKGHSITGLQVLALDNAAELGHVIDLVFDHDADQCLGLLLRERSMFHAAQLVPWQAISVLGQDAVMVTNHDSVIAPEDDANLRAIMERDAHLSGTKMMTETGDDIGTFGDVYLDENSGKVIGYEASGGLIADTMSGKRYVADRDTNALRVGDDVLLVDPKLAQEFERQETQEPGGLKGAYSSASDKVSETYGNLADASVEKQQDFVVGKQAGSDVFLPAPTGEAMQTINEDQAMVATNSSESGPLLVAKGSTITREDADRATQAEILGTLVTAAGGIVASGLLGSAQEKLGGAQSSAQGKAGETQETLKQKAIGQSAGSAVTLDDGTTLVASGMTITPDIMQRAEETGKVNAVIASAGLGTTSDTVQEIYRVGADKTGDAWDATKQKTSDLTDAAQQKKAELDEAAQQRKIKHALGRPITRIVLSQDDEVILNTGDIITHKAIKMARDSDILDVVLDSVYDTDPEITPEMARATKPGVAALPSQAEPTGAPITATVMPDQPAQPHPSQGDQQK